MNKNLAISLIIVALILGTGIGYAISPYYQQEMKEKASMQDLGPADRQVDLRYINAMIAHHRLAILLAEQAERNTERDEIKKLAQAIQKDEPPLITELYEFKKQMYNDIYPVQDPLVPQLGSKDKNADLRFLNALIAHHEEGIMMTQDITRKSTRNEILDNANSVEIFLKSTLGTLHLYRENWYNIETPHFIY